MKIALLLVIVGLAAVYADYTEGHNGKPACNAVEVAQGKWRNNFDPTKYWSCTAVGKEAVSVSCPSQEMFSPKTRSCVHNSKWVWSPPEDPPSLKEKYL